MTWALAALGVAALVGLFYWQVIVAEGTYLGPAAVAKTYDWVARRYDSIKQFSAQEESWFVAAPLLGALAGRQHPLLLDVATGTGRVPVALLRENFSGRIVGLDLSLGMLRQASAKVVGLKAAAGGAGDGGLSGDRVLWVWQGAERLPFDDETFGAVTCLESLEFFRRPLAALAEMVRVLRPGGILMVTNRIGRDARLLPRRAIPRSGFQQELSQLGLSDIQVRPWQVSYDLAMARKGPAPISAPPRDLRLDLPESGNLATLILCPCCAGRLGPTDAGLFCPVCMRTYPIRDGIVHLARRGKPAG